VRHTAQLPGVPFKLLLLTWQLWRVTVRQVTFQSSKQCADSTTVRPAVALSCSTINSSSSSSSSVSCCAISSDSGCVRSVLLLLLFERLVSSSEVVITQWWCCCNVIGWCRLRPLPYTCCLLTITDFTTTSSSSVLLRLTRNLLVVYGDNGTQWSRGCLLMSDAAVAILLM
jgi:hypothetical protein